ncbi:unnamed protein product [Paramecium pentaurelia]|uniref:Uncharacterized protein n=1 Tax=Paramecium pentaurelia TaxID=43138 RepID=A0A8S1T8C0_9CILI|nr:unnamed protein product [Paramecium pentaurelia]
MFQNSHTNNQFSFHSTIKFKKLPKLEPLFKQINQVVPQNTQRGRSFKYYLFNVTGGQCKFRRKTCTCSECGGTNTFVEKQNALQPITYIRAHHVKKRKRKMHRNKGGGRHLSAMITRVPLKIEDITNLIPTRKERKAKTLLQNQFIEQTLLKCKRLLTKDDSTIGYEYFFANELKIAYQTQEFMTNSTFEKTPTQIKQQNGNLTGSQRTIDESQVTIAQNLNINQSQVLNIQLPKINYKIKQKPSLYSPRIYQDILESHNLKPNKTVDKYISQSTHCSPVNIKLPLISQKKVIQTKRKKSEHVYLKGSPLKLLHELKSQILLQKKMSKQ